MDITYLWALEGWLYLAVVLDLFSHQVVGWSVDKRMTRKLTLDALSMAYWRRKPSPGRNVIYGYFKIHELIIIFFTDFTDQLLRSFPDILTFEDLFSVPWTPYQMVARIVDRMTCSLNHHADHISSLTAMA